MLVAPRSRRAPCRRAARRSCRVLPCGAAARRCARGCPPARRARSVRRRCRRGIARGRRSSAARRASDRSDRRRATGSGRLRHARAGTRSCCVPARCVARRRARACVATTRRSMRRVGIAIEEAERDLGARAPECDAERFAALVHDARRRRRSSSGGVDDVAAIDPRMSRGPSSCSLAWRPSRCAWRKVQRARVRRDVERVRRARCDKPLNPRSHESLRFGPFSERAMSLACGDGDERRSTCSRASRSITMQGSPRESYDSRTLFEK